VSSEFEQPDYKDLYENHSHQKTNDKTGGLLIFLYPKSETTEEDDEGLDKRSCLF
jgi:hypothetical protein